LCVKTVRPELVEGCERILNRWFVLSIKKIVCSAVLISTVIATTCWANVSFTNSANSFLMDNANARLSVSNPAKVIGFSQRSIVKAYGNNTSNAWPETYTSNAIVGNASIAGVTLPARTNLVDANSNAINVTGVTLRTTSNLLLYTARTYSSSIWVLNRRTDSTNLLTRTTSNAVNLFYTYLPVPTTDSIDGTQFMRYHTAHHVFHNNGNAWTIRGWVRFNDGFTIMPRASVLMDTLVTVSGAMDLRDTGTLILNNDLYLAHNVTLTNGGNIKGKASYSGQANTIFMGGDLTLASTTYARTLHITGDWSKSGTSGDLIIDGCGHTLNIGDRAQIFVDQNVTLTLRNMTIRTGPKSLMVPAIRLASMGSKLALDNVMFDLGADIQFKQGQIFIHDEVAVTGTSAFIYQSPVPSYITSGATWSFETGTTFSVAPSTYTDQPYTAGYAMSNNFIVLADASSALSLNGCSFKTTYTGTRFTKGMVLFDNRVAIDTQAGADLASTATSPITFVCGVVTGGNSSAVGWSPDSRFVAVTGLVGSNSLRVYRFNGSALIPVGGFVSPSNPYCVAWSPDGRFFAVTCSGTSRVEIYRFTGNSTPTLVGAASTGSTPYVVSWSPDGRWLALANNNSATLQLYRFDGVSAPVSIGTVSTGTTPQGVDWTSDGRFLAVGNNGSQTVQTYRFNGQGLPTSMGTTPTAAQFPGYVYWSPDSRFLITPNYGNQAVGLQVFRFNGSSVPASIGTGTMPPQYPSGVAFSPDGRFIATGSLNNIQIFRCQTNAAPSPIATIPEAGITEVSWSPDGKYIATWHIYDKAVIHIYRCNFYYTGQPSQGFSNGLLFGDKVKGSAYDADVRALGGATVKINGMVKDDSA
jgi:WD40 repeat protein